jgi:hypothetical protein
MSFASSNGVLVAAGLLLVGAAAAGVAWWNNLAQTRQALDFWGPEAAVLIRDAPQVTALEIDFRRSADAGSGGLVHPATGTPAEIHQERDISRARGLVHLRHALLDDRSFDWSAAPREPGELRYALSFERDGRRLVVYFSEDFTLATALGPSDAAPDQPGGASETVHVVSTKRMAEGLNRYFADVLPGAIDE